MTNEQDAELEFRKGYYLATANILRTHDQSVIAEDVLKAYGAVDFKGIDPMEIKLLKPIAAELKRKSRL
jgi:hypothetical protein